MKEQLKEVRDDVVACQKCDLYKTRNLPVVGEGDHDADIMFVGEAPGEDEDNSGRPFVGKAGQLLSSLLKDIEIERKDVYICNIVKCRPPSNRDPLKDEIESCSDYLFRQIESIKPKIVVCLGRHAAMNVLPYFGLEEEIGPMFKMHAKLFTPDPMFKQNSILLGDTSMADVKLMVLYHPASALHNADNITNLKSDFKQLKTSLESL